MLNVWMSSWRNGTCWTYEWDTSHIWMSRDSYYTYEWDIFDIWMSSWRNGTCWTYEWEILHIWMSSWHKHKCVVSRVWMSHVTQMHLEKARVVTHHTRAVRMRHVTHINQSGYTWVLNLYVCRYRRSSRQSATLLQFEWNMSHIWISPVTHMHYEDIYLQVEKEHASKRDALVMTQSELDSLLLEVCLYV